MRWIRNPVWRSPSSGVRIPPSPLNRVSDSETRFFSGNSGVSSKRVPDSLNSVHRPEFHSVLRIVSSSWGPIFGFDNSIELWLNIRPGLTILQETMAKEISPRVKALIQGLDRISLNELKYHVRRSLDLVATQGLVRAYEPHHPEEVNDVFIARIDIFDRLLANIEKDQQDTYIPDEPPIVLSRAGQASSLYYFDGKSTAPKFIRSSTLSCSGVAMSYKAGCELLEQSSIQNIEQLRPLFLSDSLRQRILEHRINKR